MRYDIISVAALGYSELQILTYVVWLRFISLFSGGIMLRFARNETEEENVCN